MSIPIVFIHKTNSDYLPYTLSQAKQSNPQSPVFLIGDRSNYYNFVNHELISDYFESASEFAKVYKHLSVNLLAYEIFCFQRWFILKDFLAKKSLDKVFYLDSDVMLYAEVTKEDNFLLEKFELAFCNISPHCVFINSKAALEKLCELIFEFYREQAAFKSMELDFKRQLRSNICTAISDMYMFAEYRKRHPNKTGELTTIIEGGTYDSNINSSEGFEMRNYKKHIEWVENKPFGNHLSLGKKIRFKALHFQGIAKVYIKDYYKQPELEQKITNSWQPDKSLPQQSELVNTMESDQENLEELQCESFEDYMKRGVALEKQNRLLEAIICFKKALQIKPDSAQTYENLGIVYSRRGLIKEAVYAYAINNALASVALKPEWAETHNNLGLAYYYNGELELAILCYKQALRLQADFLEAEKNLTRALQQQSKLEQAIVDYQQFLHLREINLLVFPDWLQTEVAIYSSLEAVMQAIMTHPDSGSITLIVDSSNLPYDSKIDVDQLFSDILLKLLMTEDIDTENAPEVFHIGKLNPKRWQTLLPYFQARLVLDRENTEAIALSGADKLASLKLTQLNLLTHDR